MERFRKLAIIPDQKRRKGVKWKEKSFGGTGKFATPIKS